MTTSESKTVLVVDDEADVRQYLTMALEDAGIGVVTAASGTEALAQMKQKVPDLISLDLVMPKGSGVRFYRELRKNKDWMKIPVLIVTGHARDDLGRADLKELTMSGSGIYLEKPVKPHSYISAIKQLLGMDTTDQESETAEQLRVQNELKNLIDSADPDTLQKLQALIKKQAE
ncbi:MAG: response regulator [candidate division Zixibacteria bacterium]|nr:response regulator [candidate division Zixibacteria bacterium]